MLSLKRAQKINQTAKDLIFGYVRKANNSISYTTIPVMINYICLLYYYSVKDRFIDLTNRQDSKLEIVSSDTHNDKRADIAKIETKDWDNIHGNVIIDPMKNPNAIATWTIKVGTTKCIIGVHSKYVSSVCIAYGGWSACYGWWGSEAKEMRGGNGSCREVGATVFNAGDLIGIELNIKEKIVKFSKNARFICTFYDIDTTESYHLMIRVGGHQTTSFQIIDFDIKNYDNLSFYSQKIV